MKRSKFVTDFSVGFVIFVATMILITSLFFVQSGWSVFGNSVEYKVRLPTASGLIRGSRVYLSGIDVGSVRSITLPEDLTVREVEVTLLVNNAYKNRIRRDSYAGFRISGCWATSSSASSRGRPTTPLTLPARSWITRVVPSSTNSWGKASAPPPRIF